MIIRSNEYQTLHRFGNNYGASVVCGPYTHGGPEGLYELAVVRFYKDAWDLTYDTPITNDVLGYLTEEGVNEVLTQIEALPPYEAM